MTVSGDSTAMMPASAGGFSQPMTTAQNAAPRAPSWRARGSGFPAALCWPSVRAITPARSLSERVFSSAAARSVRMSSSAGRVVTGVTVAVAGAVAAVAVPLAAAGAQARASTSAGVAAKV